METDTGSQKSVRVPGFEVTERRISNEHLLQFYLDYGNSDRGPWLLIGINDTEYALGWSPGVTSSPKARAGLAAVQ